MFLDAFFNHIYVKRTIAASIDFSIEVVSGFLGGYFGAMLGALVVVLKNVSPAATQKAVWMGMGFGFLFWLIAVSWVNRVLIQGMSRATIGKRIMNLEIVSTGPAISWPVMMKHWLSVSLMGEVTVVASNDQTKIAPIIPLSPKTAAAEDSNKKKAA
jgi:hypothetical protein